MLALNNVATMRRVKPRTWLVLMLTMALFALLSLALLDTGEFWIWGGLILFGGGGAMFLIMGVVHRGSAYRPGITFPEVRLDDRQIGVMYRGFAWLGAATCLGFLLYGWVAGSVLGAAGDAIGGLGTILFALAGLAAKKVHRDVDPAVAALAATLDPLRATPLRMACGGFGPGRGPVGKGETILVADHWSVSVSRHDGRQWITARHGFADIAELGVLREEQSITIYFRFRDGSDFALELDPYGEDATEPYSLCRSLLELLDRHFRPA